MSMRERVLIFGFSHHGRAVYRLLDRNGGINDDEGLKIHEW